MFGIDLLIECQFFLSCHILCRFMKTSFIETIYGDYKFVYFNCFVIKSFYVVRPVMQYTKITTSKLNWTETHYIFCQFF